MTEIWKPVAGWEDYYEVSSCGRVRSTVRTVRYADGRERTYETRVLAAATERGGHRTVNLCRGKERRSVRIHRLVLEAFVGPCPPGMEGCHNNGIASDNRIQNLRWDSHAENNRDTLRHGTHNHASKSHCVHGHEFTTENTYLHRGRRHCRKCIRRRLRESEQRRLYASKTNPADLIGDETV